jgi:hypothetical protein
VLSIELGAYIHNFFWLLSETYTHTHKLVELLGVAEVIQLQPIYTCTVVQWKIWNIHTSTLLVTLHWNAIIRTKVCY